MLGPLEPVWRRPAWPRRGHGLEWIFTRCRRCACRCPSVQANQGCSRFPPVALGRRRGIGRIGRDDCLVPGSAVAESRLTCVATGPGRGVHRPSPATIREECSEHSRSFHARPRGGTRFRAGCGGCSTPLDRTPLARTKPTRCNADDTTIRPPSPDRNGERGATNITSNRSLLHATCWPGYSSMATRTASGNTGERCVHG